MGSKRRILAVVSCVVPLLLVGVAVMRSPAPAPAASPPPPAVIQGFDAPDTTVTVTHDNLDFRNGKPYVGIDGVHYVPGHTGGAMRVDFSIIGGYWQNVMVKLNQGVPWNFTGQTQLDVTMKGDWVDRGDAQSVTLMMKMLNGSIWGVSFAVTRQWKTYSFPLDPSGKDWYSSGPPFTATSSNHRR
jgi:hypothetical protein